MKMFGKSIFDFGARKVLTSCFSPEYTKDPRIKEVVTLTSDLSRKNLEKDFERMDTPQGTFYLTELVRPIWQPYLGPYAYSTSAFSDVLYSFMGGNGNVGVHGTDAPGSIGRPVSHGCIRMTNSGITKLAGLLPLGTPLFVTA